MTNFLGTHQSRLDAKGRISIPATFRVALKDANGAAGMVLRPSHKHACIEGWPDAEFQSLASRVEQLPQFGEEHDDMAATLFADAYPMEADKDGRIVLPATLIQHAGLTDTVIFMGLGRTFQIWEPTAAERRRTEARERARNGAMTLPGIVR